MRRASFQSGLLPLCYKEKSHTKGPVYASQIKAMTAVSNYIIFTVTFFNKVQDNTSTHSPVTEITEIAKLQAV